MNRRTALTHAAWSVPVIALAVAAPSAATSTIAPTPVSCHRIASSSPGAHQWVGVYSDGSTVTMGNGDAMSSVFGSLCRAGGSNPGAGK